MKNILKQDRDILAWMPATVWAVFIFVFSVLPYRMLPPLTVGFFDKMVHFFEYAVLVVFIIRALNRIGVSSSYRSISLILILSSGYGIVMELIQRYVPGRDASPADVTANIAGIIFGIILGRLILWQK